MRFFNKLYQQAQWQPTSKLRHFSEQLAVDFLLARRVTMITTNFKAHRGEIDIIGHQNKTLIFFEVKYRNLNAFCDPEDLISYKKKKHMLLASQYFLYRFRKYQNYQPRFDLIGIQPKHARQQDHLKKSSAQYNINWITDIYA